MTRAALVAVGFGRNERTEEAILVKYPSDTDGDFALVRFTGEPEPVRVHKTRVRLAAR